MAYKTSYTQSDMTETKKSGILRQRENEIHMSHIKITKKFIIDSNLSGLLNNQKWFKIFEWLSANDINFQFKTLLLSHSIICSRIRELEKTSILIDDSGDFIEFLEIEKLTVIKTKELVNFIEMLKVEYIDRNEYIDIIGYIK